MQSYKEHFTNKSYLFSFFIGLVLIIIALLVQFWASTYATRNASSSVADIVLSNTRVYDIGGIFVYGSVFLFFIVLAIVVRKPKYLPFALKSVATFTLIRSVFVTLTHISSFPARASIDSVFFKETAFRGIFSGDGLFFSGHTGLPFLLALMFWNVFPLRIFFLAASLNFGIVVLLGHIHYSIDVLSAFFITYSIFQICIFLYREDWKLFNS